MWHQAPWLWHTLLTSLLHPTSRLSLLDLEAVQCSLVGVDPSLLARYLGIALLQLPLIQGTLPPLLPTSFWPPSLP